MTQDDVMLDVQRTLGRIEAKLDGHLDAFKTHVEDDRTAYKALGEIKQTQARQKGFLTALGMVGSAMGAGVGYIIERLTFGGHQ